MFELKAANERDLMKDAKDSESLRRQKEIQEEFDAKVEYLEGQITSIINLLQRREREEEQNAAKAEQQKRVQPEVEATAFPELPAELEQAFIDLAEQFVECAETEEEFQKHELEDLIQELKNIRKSVIRFLRKHGGQEGEIEADRLGKALLGYLKSFNEQVAAPAIFSPNYVAFDPDELEEEKWYVELKDYIVYE